MPIQMLKIQLQILLRSSRCASKITWCVWVYMCVFCSFASIVFTSYRNLYNDTSVRNIWLCLIHFLASFSVPVKRKETVVSTWSKIQKYKKSATYPFINLKMQLKKGRRNFVRFQQAWIYLFPCIYKDGENIKLINQAWISLPSECEWVEAVFTEVPSHCCYREIF